MTDGNAGSVVVEGPYFNDLAEGMVFDSSPGITLTEGAAALHQSIMGGRLRMPLDRDLSERVLGPGRWLADPSYVWDVAIGQSTQATQNVLANLYYRGLVFQRTPVLGDTLHTTTKVVGLRTSRERPGQAPTGLAALRITTRDQGERTVLDFWRCAMLPRRPGVEHEQHHQTDLSAVGREVQDDELVHATAAWTWSGLDQVPRPHVVAEIEPGCRYHVASGDVVSSAAELARLTTNMAAVHHDNSRSAQGRLVYGGHTIGLALAQATRALPGLITVTAWHSCDHLGPVREGDTLTSTVEVESVKPLGGLVSQVHLRSVVTATASPGADRRPVLDWRFVAVTM